MALERWRRLLPGLWAGGLLAVALLATPAPFALLARSEAGRVVSRMLAQEAHASLALGVLLLVLERLRARRTAEAGAGSQISAEMMLCLGALMCTVLGYFVIQPLMVGARGATAGLSFAQLHAVSVAFYVVKVALVLVLAWRCAAATGQRGDERPVA